MVNLTHYAMCIFTHNVPSMCHTHVAPMAPLGWPQDVEDPQAPLIATHAHL